MIQGGHSFPLTPLISQALTLYNRNVFAIEENLENLQSSTGKILYHCLSARVLQPVSSHDIMIRVGLVIAPKKVNDDTDGRFLLRMLHVPNPDGVK